MSSLQPPESANEVWLKNLQRVIKHGRSHSPRGMETLEILNNESVVDMRLPVITIPAREMGYKFLVAEALWILQGNSGVETIAPFSKQISQFSDDGYVFQGAYGPKVADQLRYVVETLSADPSSRQAVISIWRENPRPSKDIPCTLSLQFLVREGRINCIANMRSSDLWLGWVYDVFNFTMITTFVALRLRDAGQHLELGSLYLNAGSQHLYRKNYTKACEASQGVNAWSYDPLDLSYFKTPHDLIIHLYALRDYREMQTQGFLNELRHHVP